MQKKRKREPEINSAQIRDICKKSIDRISVQERNKLKALPKDLINAPLLEEALGSSLLQNENQNLRNYMLDCAVRNRATQNAGLLLCHGATQTKKADCFQNPEILKLLARYSDSQWFKCKCLSYFNFLDCVGAFWREDLKSKKSKSLNRQNMNIILFYGFKLPAWAGKDPFPTCNNFFLQKAHARRVGRLAAYLRRCTGFPTDLMLLVAQWRYGDLNEDEKKLLTDPSCSNYKIERT